MKQFKKYWKQSCFIIFAILLGCYVCLFAFKSATNFTIYSKPNVELKVYSVWHIETFEGGGKSRLTYLKNLASDIEKQNAGVLFNVIQVEPEVLSDKLSNSTPDIISFGYGVGKTVLPYLTNLTNTYSVRDELVLSGSFSNKVYAIPYIVSGYAKFVTSENNTKTLYGFNPYTCPNDVAGLIKQPSQYEAYKTFVNNKNYNLVGTCRDLFRVNNLININRISATITPLSDFSDLIQYIACCNADDITELFISKLLSDEYQAKLTDYSLFSSLGTKIYSTGIYYDMENALLQVKIPSVF